MLPRVVSWLALTAGLALATTGCNKPVDDDVWTISTRAKYSDNWMYYRSVGKPKFHGSYVEFVDRDTGKVTILGEAANAEHGHLPP